MKNMKILNLIKEFGFKHTIKTGLNYFLYKITKNQKYKDNLFKITENYIIQNYKHVFSYENNSEKPNNDFKIWLFWWQGIDENSPEIIKSCINSIKQNMPNNEIIILDKNNLSKFIELPDYILEKVDKKIITLTHLSDIVRVSLLAKYGGLWLDSTIYMTQSIKEDLLNFKFYTNRLPYKDEYKIYVSNARWSSFFLFATKNNPLVINLQNIFFEYWKTHNIIINYLFIDYAISTLYKNVECIKHIIDIVPENNPCIYELGNHLFDKYDENKLDSLLKSSKIFKLSYKFSDQQKELNNTIYKKLIEKK